MKTIPITLTEFSAAKDAAWLRIVASSAQRLDPATTYKRSMLKRLEEEIVGAVGEIAVGKWSDRFFVPSVGTFHRVPDCFSNLEVRSTRLESGSLIVRDNDADERDFVLAVLVEDCVRLCGWISGAAAKQPEFRRNPKNHRPAWFVPQTELLDMEDLRRE